MSTIKEIKVIQYEYNGYPYETLYKAKLAAIGDLLPAFDYVEWLADPANLQKIIDLG